LGVNQISASYVSKVAQELDEQVRSFLERPIDSHIPYMFVNASYFKVRDGIQYVNKALLVVAGVREDGYRKILGVRVADAEHELTREGIFSDLKDRGLKTVDLIISDAHTEIQSAAGKMFLGSSWQICHVHFIRAVLRKVSRAYPPEHWKKIRTTNLLERIHKEIKRRTKKVGAFTNDASLLRLAVSILIDTNEDWITGNRYLSMKSEMITLDTGAEFTTV
jgi:transposase-like protein